MGRLVSLFPVLPLHQDGDVASGQQLLAETLGRLVYKEFFLQGTKGGFPTNLKASCDSFETIQVGDFCFVFAYKPVVLLRVVVVVVWIVILVCCCRLV